MDLLRARAFQKASTDLVGMPSFFSKLITSRYEMSDSIGPAGEQAVTRKMVVLK
jgi:hypothetical protein